MLVTIQFPFADSRKFLNNTGRLERPVWPLPIPDTEFVRNFGSIRVRKLGGVGSWVSENEICEAERSLRFKSDLSYFDASSKYQLLLRCAFRRLYFDGWAVGKLEVGISDKNSRELFLRKDKSQKLIEHILQLPVSVSTSLDNAKVCELISAGKYLANAYRNATTSYKAVNSTQEWWVRQGEPLIFLHYKKEEVLQFPYWSTPVNISPYKLQLVQFWVPFKGTNVRMWMLGYDHSRVGYEKWRSRDYEDERALRISLLRLHAEHQCLRSILRDIQTKKIVVIPRTNESDNLQQYLNNATRRIGKLETQSATQFDTEMVNIARESMSVFSPGDRENLLGTLESLDIRKNVLRKVELYTDQWKDATFENVRINFIQQEVNQMADEIYNVSGQAGAVGSHAEAHDMTFNQIKTQTGDTVDLAALAQQLAVLRTKLKEEAVEPEQDAAVGAVAEAEVEAKKGNGAKVLEALKKAGSWALSIATQIGVPLATEVIKQAIGIK